MKKKNLKKLLLAVCCAALLVCVSIGATVAYLTSHDEVKNTFTVGKVKITLDEAKVTEDGTPVEGAARVKENSYKLMPGHTYTKDPTVHVEKGSEDCYVKMTVTINKIDELDKIFAPNGADLTAIFKNYKADTWISKGHTDDMSAKTRAFEFWYKEKVTDAASADKTLPALFDAIVVPGTITGEQLAKLEGLKITVNAYAIQADGFADANAAWTAFNG